MAARQTEPARGCFAAWTEWRETSSDLRAEHFEIGMKDILLELIDAEHRLRSAIESLDDKTTNADLYSLQQNMQSVDELIYMLHGCIVALRVPDTLDTPEAVENRIVRKVCIAFMKLCDKRAHSTYTAIEDGIFPATFPAPFDPITVLEHLLPEIEHDTTTKTSLEEHQQTVSRYDYSSSTVEGERICDCPDCTRLGESYVSKLNRIAKRSFQQKMRNFSLIQRTFLEAPRPQVQEFVKFIAFVLQVESRNLESLKLKFDRWTYDVRDGMSENDLQTNLPSRMLSQASMIRGLCHLLLSTQQACLTPAVPGGTNSQQEMTCQEASKLPIKHLAGTSELLMSQAHRLMDLQDLAVKRGLISGLPSRREQSQVQPIAPPVSETVTESDIIQDPVESNTTSSKETEHDKPQPLTVASDIGTHAPAPFCRASRLEQVLFDTDDVLPPAITAATTHDDKRRAWEATTPSIDTVLDWELATREPRQSQFEEEGAKMWRREKVKTRREPAVSNTKKEQQELEGEQEFDRHADDPTQAAPARRKWIFKNPAHYDTMRVLFPLPGEKDKEGTLTWTAFCSALGAEPFSFKVTHQKNVAYTFTRAEGDGLKKMSITLHKPHDKLTVSRDVVRNYGLALRHKLGLAAEDIELEDETATKRAERRDAV